MALPCGKTSQRLYQYQPQLRKGWTVEGRSGSQMLDVADTFRSLQMPTSQLLLVPARAQVFVGIHAPVTHSKSQSVGVSRLQRHALSTKHTLCPQAYFADSFPTFLFSRFARTEVRADKLPCCIVSTARHTFRVMVLNRNVPSPFLLGVLAANIRHL